MQREKVGVGERALGVAVDLFFFCFEFLNSASLFSRLDRGRRSSRFFSLSIFLHPHSGKQMLSSVVRRQTGGLVASLTPYLRTAAASRGFAAAAEEQVRMEFLLFSMPFVVKTHGSKSRAALFLPAP